MSEEQVRGIIEKLEKGVEVKNKLPDYFNAVVGNKYVGYVISLLNASNKQINIILKIQNRRETFKQSTIPMTIHSIFRYGAEGEEEQIESSLIGHEVILKTNTESSKVNNCYLLTGILKLKNKPP